MILWQIMSYLFKFWQMTMKIEETWFCDKLWVIYSKFWQITMKIEEDMILWQIMIYLLKFWEITSLILSVENQNRSVPDGLQSLREIKFRWLNTSYSLWHWKIFHPLLFHTPYSSQKGKFSDPLIFSGLFSDPWKFLLKISHP